MLGKKGIALPLMLAVAAVAAIGTIAIINEVAYPIVTNKAPLNTMKALLKTSQLNLGEYVGGSLRFTKGTINTGEIGKNISFECFLCNEKRIKVEKNSIEIKARDSHKIYAVTRPRVVCDGECREEGLQTTFFIGEKPGEFEFVSFEVSSVDADKNVFEEIVLPSEGLRIDVGIKNNSKNKDSFLLTLEKEGKEIFNIKKELGGNMEEKIIREFVAPSVGGEYLYTLRLERKGASYREIEFRIRVFSTKLLKCEKIRFEETIEETGACYLRAICDECSLVSLCRNLFYKEMGVVPEGFYTSPDTDFFNKHIVIEKLAICQSQEELEEEIAQGIAKLKLVEIEILPEMVAPKEEPREGISLPGTGVGEPVPEEPTKEEIGEDIAKTPKVITNKVVKIERRPKAAWKKRIENEITREKESEEKRREFVEHYEEFKTGLQTFVVDEEKEFRIAKLDSRPSLKNKIYKIARRFNIDPYLFAALIYHESGFQKDVISSAGAVGLGQILIDTAYGACKTVLTGELSSGELARWKKYFKERRSKPERLKSYSRELAMKIGLFEEEINLMCSAMVYSNYRERCGGDDIIGLAAYNAGTAAAGCPNNPHVPDYTETKKFVRNIPTLANRWKQEFIEAKKQQEITTGKSFGFLGKPTTRWKASSCYGERILRGKRDFHDGIDFPVSVGSPVYAMYDGVVYRTCAGWCGGFGNSIAIKHWHPSLGTFYTGYHHLQRILVSKGQTITKGSIIARSGNTGISTGPHLDIKVWTRADYVWKKDTGINPLPLFSPEDRAKIGC